MPTTCVLPDGSELVVEPLLRTRGRLGLKNFDPCTILLNDDLSAGLPPVLQHLHEPVSYTHLRAHETVLDLVCRLLLEKKKTHYVNTLLHTLSTDQLTQN